MEALRFDNVFNFSIEVDEGLIPEALSIPSMLIQPYVENAIWHGLLHKETNDGKLAVRFYQQKNNVLIAEIVDNGVGRKKAKELRSKDAIKKKSYGMQITEDRIFLINELYNINAKVTVEDLTNEQGQATGTKVILEVAATDV
jgi:sensor histidine kinase YesM